MRFELAPGVRRTAGGRLLAGGTPPRLLRLSEQGAATLDRILGAGDGATARDGGGDRPATEPTDGPDGGAELPAARSAEDLLPGGGEPDDRAETLARRLASDGVLTPVPPDPAPAATMTTVVPVRDGGPGLNELVATLRERGEVIVVDDRSTDGSGGRAAAAGATVVTNAGAPGPAGARNTGLRAATTELVAFVDADCRAEPSWCDGLATLLEADPQLALAGPRVRSAPGRSAPARHERRHSPLDLGPLPSLVGPGRRIGYLPAAALVARRETLLTAGGFDEELRYGEDVDLVWRLVAAGHRVRYVPTSEVEHEPRPTLAALASQRRGYGNSAAALETRHPGAATPLRASAAAYLTWAAALRGPLSAAAALGFGAWRASRRSENPASRRALAEIAIRGQATASLRLARALRREWLPVTAAALAIGGRPRRIALTALAVDSLTAIVASPGADSRTARDSLAGDTTAALSLLDPRAAALRLLDDAAYAVGLWEGAIRAGSPASLLPRLGPRRP